MDDIPNATYIVHWPGKDTPACDKHTQQLTDLARTMGFKVSVTPWPEDNITVICTNCINEAFSA